MLNRKRLGYDLLVFVKVIIQGHTTELIAKFDEAIKNMPEVLESHRIIGDAGPFPDEEFVVATLCRASEFLPGPERSQGNHQYWIERPHLILQSGERLQLNLPILIKGAKR